MTQFNRFILSLIMTALCALGAYSSPVMPADDNDDDTSNIKVGSGRVKPLQGYYFFDDENGDNTLMLVLADVTVYPPLKFKNKKEEEFYWKTVRDVKKTLPYAKLICETLIETYEYIETFPTQQEREEHLKKMKVLCLNNTSPY